MKFIVVAFACVCFAQAVFGRPEKSATPNVDEFFTNLSNTFQEVSQKLVGDDVVKHFKESTNDLMGNVNTFLNQISEKTKDLQPANEAITKFQEKVKGYVEDFKKQNPEAAESASKMKENFDNVTKKIWEETKKVQKEMKDNSGAFVEDFNKFAKNAMDQMTANAKRLETELLQKKQP